MTSITDILTPLRLRRLFCTHHQTVHASVGTRCVSCGQRV